MEEAEEDGQQKNLKSYFTFGFLLGARISCLTVIREKKARK